MLFFYHHFFSNEYHHAVLENQYNYLWMIIHNNHFGLEAVYMKDDNASDVNLSFCLGFNEGEFASGAGMTFNILGNVSRLDY